MLRRQLPTTITRVFSSSIGRNVVKRQSSAAFFSTCTRQMAAEDHVSTITKETLKTQFGISELSKLQRQVIEALQENDHVAVNTLANNGKTLSYLIPGLELVLRTMREEEQTKLPGFRLLILTNTKERTALIMEQVNKLISAYDNRVKAIALTGGQSLEREINYLDHSQPEIVVGTVGRIRRHMKNSDYFDNVKLVVVDNANKLGNYTNVMQDIFQQLPKQRKTVALSVASDIVAEQSPLVPIIFPDAAPQSQISTSEREFRRQDSIKFSHVNCKDAKDFVGKLQSFLAQNRSKKVAVRVYSVAMVNFLMNALAKNGVYVIPLHHQQPPTLRRSLVTEYNKQPNAILVGTEVIDSALQNDVDIIVTAEAEYENVELLASHLKSGQNTEFVSFLLAPFESKPLTGSLERNVTATTDLVLPDRKCVETLFFSHLITKSKNVEDKEFVVDAVSAFAQQMGLTALPPVNYTTAKKHGLDKVLKSRNLLGAL